MTTPSVTLLVSINGGAFTSGAITATFSQTVAMQAAATQPLSSIRYEITDYPPGLSVPSGWSTDPTTGAYFFAPSNPATTPPVFTLPVSGQNNWGLLMLRLRGNTNPLRLNADGSPNVSYAPQLTDTATCISVPSPVLGLPGFGAGLTTQFDSMRAWAGLLMQHLRLLDSAPFGGGGGGGGGGSPTTTLANTFQQPVVGDPAGVVATLTAAPSPALIGCSLTIATGGYYTVKSVVGSTATLINNLSTNTAAGVFIAAGSVVAVASGNAPIAITAPGEGTAGIVTSGVYQNTPVRPKANPKTVGAVCDCQFTAQVGQITTGTNSLTLSAGTPFVLADVGKHITVTGAGAAGADLHTTIAGFSSNSHVTLAANASTTVPSAAGVFPPVPKAWVIWGTDDSTAWGAAITAAAATSPGRVLYVPASSYLVSTQTLPTNVALECEEGAVIHSEATLNVYGRVKAHESQQIFSNATQVALYQQGGTKSSRTTKVYAAWWGAVGDASNFNAAGGTDNTVAFRSAIAAACTVGNTVTGTVGGELEIGVGAFIITDTALTVDQGLTGAAGVWIHGKSTGADGAALQTLIVCCFAEPSGTGATLTSAGVLTTGGGDPAWLSTDVGQWVITTGGTHRLCIPSGTVPPAVSIDTGGSTGVNYKIQLLKGGARGTATFQWSSNGGTTYNGPVTTAATTALSTGATITWPNSTYSGIDSLLSSGTTPPAVTISSLGTVQSRLELRIVCTTGGALAGAAVKVSADNGQTYGAPQAIAGGTLSVVIPDGTLTLTFPNTTYNTDNVWASAIPNAYFCPLTNGARQVTAFTSSTQVTIAEPSLQFPLASLQASDTAVNWWKVSRKAIQIWSRGCTVENLSFIPGAVPVYAFIEDTKSPNGSVACSNNIFKNINCDTLGKTGAAFVTGFTHGDTALQPGGNTTSIQDCENNHYYKCFVTRFSYSGFLCPNVSGQAYDTVFEQCIFTGELLTSVVGIDYRWGSFHVLGGGPQYCRVGIIPGFCTNATMVGMNSEGCDRIMWRISDTQAPFFHKIDGGRFATNQLAEDGLYYYSNGTGSDVMISAVFDSGGYTVPYFKIRVQTSAGATAPTDFVATGCMFPLQTPFLHPAPSNGQFAMRLTNTGNKGYNLTSFATLIPDVQSQVCGP